MECPTSSPPSKEIFFKNQDILTGDKSKLRGTYKILNPEYPLRGFVKCMNCSKRLTGSASTGSNGVKYPRYTCNAKGCKTGFVTPDDLHEQFKVLLSVLQPTPRKTELLRTLIIRKWSQQSRSLNEGKKKLNTQLHDLEEKQLSLTEKMASNEIDSEDYRKLRAKYRNMVLQFENELADTNKKLKLKTTDIDYAISYLADAPRLWQDAGPEMKVMYQNMVFPKGIKYDLQNKQFGTPELSALYSLANMKKDPSKSEESLLVIPRGIEPLCPG